MKKPAIHTYLNYHDYLRDAQKAIKKSDPGFTVRNIAKMAGLGSPGHISWIFQGKRNITRKMIPVFAGIFRMSDEEKEYFRALVHFNNSKSHKNKKHFFEKIVSLQKSGKRVVSSRELKYWSRWYYPVVRELAAIHRITDDNYKDAAHLLVPKISPREMKQALYNLERLGYIKKDGSGIYRRADKVVSSGEGWKSLAIHEYQMNIMELGKKALDDIDKSERDISTVTLSISEKNFKIIKEKIRKLREEIITLARTDSDPERIFQTGFLFFPVSESKKDGGQDE